ncbi:MAG: hypothetical protein QXP36_02075 [Conexivisphaerales archaeon]
MEFTKSEWANFISMLTAISAAGFDDCILKNGIIRQTNVSNTMIVNIDLEKDISFEVQIIKSFLPLYKSFSPIDDNGSVIVETTSSNIYISDGISSIEIHRPVEKMLSCKFLDEVTFSAYGISNDSLCNFTVNENLSAKLKAIRDNFMTTIFNVNTKNKKSTIEFTSYSNTRSAKVISFESNLPDVNLSVSCNIIDFPFDSAYNISILEMPNSHKYIAKITGSISDKNVTVYAIANTL